MVAAAVYPVGSRLYLTSSTVAWSLWVIITSLGSIVSELRVYRWWHILYKWLIFILAKVG